MRNLIVGAVTAAALLGAPAAAEAAPAAPVAPPWTPVSNPLGPGTPAKGPVTVPAGRACAFALDIAVVVSKEVQQVKTRADGTMVATVKGKLILSFKNDTTGKTIKENVSGPSTTTMRTDGSAIVQGAGLNWLLFGAHSKKNTGEPGLVFTNGRVTVTYKGGAAQKFSLKGTQQNGCALLS